MKAQGIQGLPRRLPREGAATGALGKSRVWGFEVLQGIVMKRIVKFKRACEAHLALDSWDMGVVRC